MHFPLLLPYLRVQGHRHTHPDILFLLISQPKFLLLSLYFRRPMCKRSSHLLFPLHKKTRYHISRYNVQDSPLKSVRAADRSSGYPVSLPLLRGFVPVYHIFRRFRYNNGELRHPNLPPHHLPRIYQIHLQRTVLFLYCRK